LLSLPRRKEMRLIAYGSYLSPLSRDAHDDWYTAHG